MPNETSPAASALSKRQIFFRRLLSFVVLWTIILTALFSGNKLLSDCVFLVVMVLLAGAGLWEFYG
ncbi:MAG: Phosphatidate cytidylyltransferase, partial [Pedosphaera sp.]|nr:Phosphatidate cytidylyltransferase [Pedosphaera sp.]